MQTAVLNPKKRRNGAINTLQTEDVSVHGWYRYVLSFPPHLVRQYIARFEISSEHLVLDPFCGTGTTLVEAKLHRIPCVGCDAHPFAALVSRVKTNWLLDSRLLRITLKRILRGAAVKSAKHGLNPLSFDAAMLQEEPNRN